MQASDQSFTENSLMEVGRVLTTNESRRDLVAMWRMAGLVLGRKSSSNTMPPKPRSLVVRSTMVRRCQVIRRNRMGGSCKANMCRRWVFKLFSGLRGCDLGRLNMRSARGWPNPTLSYIAWACFPMAILRRSEKAVEASLDCRHL